MIGEINYKITNYNYLTKDLKYPSLSLTSSRELNVGVFDENDEEIGYKEYLQKGTHTIEISWLPLKSLTEQILIKVCFSLPPKPVIKPYEEGVICKVKRVYPPHIDFQIEPSPVEISVSQYSGSRKNVTIKNIGEFSTHFEFQIERRYNITHSIPYEIGLFNNGCYGPEATKGILSTRVPSTLGSMINCEIGVTTPTPIEKGEYVGKGYIRIPTLSYEKPFAIIIRVD
jgi:hypothetical protein